jgi:hypothetical protein
MYSIEGIKKGLSQPQYILRELDRLYYTKLRRWSYNKNGIDIFQQDWDNLLILDACRFDLFEEVADLPGQTGAVQSRGSATKEFLRGNFDGQVASDTVYVTASPMLYRQRDSIDVEFHDVVNVWKEQGWNEQYRTVMPETMGQATLEAAERFPDKRLLVHFIQPHYPFIGPTGEKHFNNARLNFQWGDVASGELELSEDVLRRAYRENLEAVLPTVEHLCKTLSGRTVVTADHGQMFGKRIFPIPVRTYGHPSGLYSEELVKVPWHVFEGEHRREITAEDQSEQTESRHEDEELARERLRDLGYVQ